jgi:hypothetical protein
VDAIRGVRAFLEGIKPSAEIDELAPPSIGVSQEGLSKEKLEPSLYDRFWPSDWSKVMLADEPEAALGAQFFTRTTRQQEEAVKAVRGVTVVNGIAGTGKTSIALGRLKFFANFRSGEHLQDYGLNPNDWADFDSSDMVGFVLSPSLVQYLKQTAEDLEMRIKIVDFEEFRNQERQSRRIFGRPFKRSPDLNSQIQQTVSWLSALGRVASIHIADAIDKIQMEALTRPSTLDGSRITESRWREIEGQLWRAGPLRGRITGLVRYLRSEGSATTFPLQGIGNAIDRDVRFSDRETVALTDWERRAIREAILNISLRFFRLLNPSELYLAIHKSASLKTTLAAHFGTQLDVANQASERTAARLEERLVTDDDLVSTLCLNALICDEFDRDLREFPYLRTFSDRVGVFIDEYQDFSEQQVFLMGVRAKRKYRQITASGDTGQRLHVGGTANIANAFPYVTEPVRQILLDTNFRQSKALALLSQSFRAFTDGGERNVAEPCGAPIQVYLDQRGFAEFMTTKISSLPDTASVAVISPNEDTARKWFDMMAPGLQSAFRNPIISDRTRLTERLKTHFTTPLEAKGLEFDVAVIPDISEFNEADLISLNGLYVAVSRPRHAILLGCDHSKVGHKIVERLCRHGDLIPVTPSLDATVG